MKVKTSKLALLINAMLVEANQRDTETRVAIFTFTTADGTPCQMQLLTTAKPENMTALPELFNCAYPSQQSTAIH